MSADRCCVLFTKPALPGRVKTRLHSVLSPGQAAALHQAFLDDLTPRLLAGDFEFRIAWALDPSEELPRSPVESFRQEGESLGERLHDGLSRAAREFALVAAVGGDHPDLTTRTVEESFARLAAGAEVVIGPAHDGGYYLIAMHAGSLDREIFEDIPWSTNEVFDRTLTRCQALGLGVSVLPAGHDVDSPMDLARLERLLATGSHQCPNTEKLLRSWGRVP